MEQYVNKEDAVFYKNLTKELLSAIENGLTIQFGSIPIMSTTKTWQDCSSSNRLRPKSLETDKEFLIRMVELHPFNYRIKPI